jgi:hypothetical protein
MDEWDTEVELRVIMRVRARPNPEYFEGWQNRTPEGLAQTALLVGRDDPEGIDGYADLTGQVDIMSVEIE